MVTGRGTLPEAVKKRTDLHVQNARVIRPISPGRRDHAKSINFPEYIPQ